MARRRVEQHGFPVDLIDVPFAIYPLHATSTPWATNSGFAQNRLYMLNPYLL